MFMAKVQRRTYRDVSDLALKLKGPTRIKVGLPAGEADGERIKIGIYNEFGTRGSGKGFSTPRGGGFGGPVPERPFMRNAMRSNRGKYQRMMSKSAKLLLSGSTSMTAVLRSLGVLAQGDIQDEIMSLKSPANAPLTIALKGSANPLVDTGGLHGAITWKVDD
ncbi:hypothetical protein [Aurantimonas coralicida]|uniref:hypothetical protein n=1 Tax=Aurantimonas coralicida TaxID=182270 RepID=UPI002390ECBA|nr:hypothetical protein [Aurantimonas coralicida]MDE0922385.1 hypothetical protein [Aurantimonas coralicida]